LLAYADRLNENTPQFSEIDSRTGIISYKPTSHYQSAQTSHNPFLDNFRIADHAQTGLVCGHKGVFDTDLPWRGIVSSTVEFAVPVSLSLEP
jgi:hypothetical protein